ncbi:uncharacterized protein VTP21DRAFT_8424 [Calcarisporiella thermophila]|uniref:uncharacterized protein n=1 Tax=Calcarisporiella thermophila TaxID=911321 RepID=UPI003744238A
MRPCRSYQREPKQKKSSRLYRLDFTDSHYRRRGRDRPIDSDFPAAAAAAADVVGRGAGLSHTHKSSVDSATPERQPPLHAGGRLRLMHPSLPLRHPKQDCRFYKKKPVQTLGTSPTLGHGPSIKRAFKPS